MMPLRLNTRTQYLRIHISAREEINRLRRDLQVTPENMKKAAARALNRTLEAIRSEGVRIAREKYTARSHALRSSIRIVRAKRTLLYGYVNFHGRKGRPMGDFSVRERGINYRGVLPKERRPVAGISARVKQAGDMKPRTGPDGEKSFWGTVHSKPMLFYRRQGLPNDDPKSLRLLYGPNPIETLMNQEAATRLQDRANEMFATRLRHEVRRLLDTINL